MTTVRQIIADAYEESGLIPINSTPQADEQSKGLRRLKTVIKSLFGNELGEKLQDISVGETETTEFAVSSSFVPANSRLVCNLGESFSIYLPPEPCDGARLGIVDVAGNFSTYPFGFLGGGRLIEGETSLILDTDSITREWFYRADLGNWVVVDDIDDNSDSPFPSEFDDLLITMLAMRLNPGFGVEMSGESAAALNRSKAQFKARYKQSEEVASELGLWPSHYPNNFSLGI